MTGNKVVKLSDYRANKVMDSEEETYRAKIKSMRKVELLEEMVRFQEERKQAGGLTMSLMVRGKILFAELENQADSAELKILSRSYRRHLEYEIAASRSS